MSINTIKTHKCYKMYTKIQHLPNELLDMIILYLPKTHRTNIIPLICKDFLNTHMYRMKIGKVAITTRITKHLTGSYSNDVLKKQNDISLDIDWFEFLMLNNINFTEYKRYINYNSLMDNGYKKTNCNKSIEYKRLIKDNIIFYNLLYTCKKLTVITNQVSKLLDDIKYTNISTLVVINNGGSEDTDILHIPHNIIDIKLKNVIIKDIIFPPKSKVKTVKFSLTTCDMPVRLPNNIENITYFLSDINFVNTSFNRLKYAYITDNFISDYYEWKEIALFKATEFAYGIPYKNHVISSLRAKCLEIDIEQLEHVNRNVESLCIHHFYRYCNQEYDKYINLFKNLKQLNINVRFASRNIISIKSDYIIKLNINCSDCNNEHYISQKVDIQCKRLEYVNITNCDILDIDDSKIKKLSLSNCIVNSGEFPNLKTIKLDNVKIMEDDY